MRSVVVVLPASICAMMPMFLQRSNGTVLATVLLTLLSGAPKIASGCRLAARCQEQLRLASLPPIMCKRLVGFRHAVHVFLLLDRRATIVGCVQQFVRELVNHAFFATATRVGNQPADRQ